jgi:hypothetical protein
MHVVVFSRAPMGMKVPVRDSIVFVHVTVDAERAHESDSAQEDQRDANDALEGGSKRIGEPPTGEHERAADQQNHDRVADAPPRSNRERTTPVRSTAHEDTDRGEMIGRE